MKKYDLVIVGGGAAGLAAAVMAARKGLSVLIAEKGRRVGKKLLATGNGTCNITNRHATPGNYHGAAAADFVLPALRYFPPEAAIDFFGSVGVVCIPRDDGRVYPLCEQASAVLDCLRLSADDLGVETLTESPVTALSRRENGWTVTMPTQTVSAKAVLVAAGGCASPALGGGNDGYTLLTSCGHTRTPLFPSIVQLKTDTALIRAVKGVRVDARVSLWLHGNELAAETGEILFTEYGVSGPAAMYISRAVGDWERRKNGEMTLHIDLLPAVPAASLRERLIARKAIGGRTTADFFTGLLQNRLGQTLVRAAGLSLTLPTAELTDKNIAVLTTTVKDFSVSVLGTQGFGGAQVTAGGIATAEFDPETLQSRRAPGLYAAGEVLDVDGDCGGFNLQWAWASAALAVKAIAGETT